MECNHDWEEVYYGWRCRKCSQFFAFGCAPWDEPERTWTKDNTICIGKSACGGCDPSCPAF